MFPILITIAKGALIVVFLAAFFTAMRSNSRMMKRARESGYSIFNPMASFAAWRTIEFPLFIMAVLSMAGAVAMLKALQ